MNSETKDCAYCQHGNIVETLINVPNSTAQDNGYRYNCNNEKCGLKYRLDSKGRQITMIESKWGKGNT